MMYIERVRPTPSTNDTRQIKNRRRSRSKNKPAGGGSTPLGLFDRTRSVRSIVSILNPRERRVNDLQNERLCYNLRQVHRADVATAHPELSRALTRAYRAPPHRRHPTPTNYSNFVVVSDHTSSTVATHDNLRDR
jgi:hypothetical protein